ncbi:hypothetical protein [Mucilaginibacter lappiensis]|uniref:Uncharacterized protein n=1 Tax=Mucilaginibacter lappiensis TaxID=354630 RepID=A0A841J710_9SPHI|nr:hypothetical protein [Mucilaginibacter lappiensis]MBB6126969.1 hypothetical protein [Mucilaginibacter lappiensis]
MIKKINGYDLSLAFGIHLNGDRSTTNSFEVPNDVNPVFSHTWDDGVVEYDLNATPTLAPRVFTINGYMVVGFDDDYVATKMALNTILYQNYVTFEDPDLDIKVNARLKPGGNKWNRITPLDAATIVVEVTLQFDEILQDVPFKDDEQQTITYLVDSQLRYYNTQDNKFMISSNG